MKLVLIHGERGTTDVLEVVAANGDVLLHVAPAHSEEIWLNEGDSVTVARKAAPAAAEVVPE